MRLVHGILGAMAATMLMLATASAPAATDEGTILGAGDPTAIPCSYIVVFKDEAANAQGVDALIDALAAKAGARVEHRYRSLLPGFAGTMTEQAARRLAADPAVKYVEQNHIVSTAGTQSPLPAPGSTAPSSGTCR